jgi:UDP:flavonoid glycosyltransferase YjiC (YdhE family)
VTAATVAFFCMAEGGHFRRLRPLICAEVAAGMDVVVFTDRALAWAVREAGARFVDLFAGRPLSVADDESRPLPCRYVSFAGRFADSIIAEARALRPRLVITDSFAVIGRVVAAALDVPHVNVCSGHNVHPAHFLPMLAEDPRVDVSDACHRAVERLRERFGLEAPSPFSFVAPPSPFLNVYCEPRQYLTAAERDSFEPVVFFGSLPEPEAGRWRAPPAFPAGAERRVYVSFGTVVWRYYAREAIATLRSISVAVARRPRTFALVSLGRASLAGELVAELQGGRVRVMSYVDQPRVLAQADAFITHHGLNSTHEAVFHRVPMLSHPFFWDQPALAQRAQDFGVALPLAATPRAAVDVDDVEQGLDRLGSEHARLGAALARAHGWEEEVLASRPATVRRIAELV